MPLFSTMLRAGAAAAGLEPNNRSESKDQKIAKLGVEVCQRMTAAEKAKKEENETCCGLYGNFFLSILALAESAVRLLIHFFIVLIFFFGYYIILCLSCGKSEAGNAMIHQMTRVSMYSGLLAAMLGNILMPWRPTLYLFHTPSNLSRPHVPHMSQEPGLPSSLDIENCCIDMCCCCCNVCGCKRGQCACCGTVAESVLPPYKMAQSALFVVGCCTGCGCYQCTGGRALTDRIGVLVAQTETDSRVATTAFYQSQYNVASWEALVASRVGGAPMQYAQQQPYMQQQQIPQQQYMQQQSAPKQQYRQQQQVPPAQVNFQQSTPVVMAQPVSS